MGFFTEFGACLWRMPIGMIRATASVSEITPDRLNTAGKAVWRSARCRYLEVVIDVSAW
jgi:hypothetical protein